MGLTAEIEEEVELDHEAVNARVILEILSQLNKLGVLQKCPVAENSIEAFERAPQRGTQRGGLIIGARETIELDPPPLVSGGLQRRAWLGRDQLIGQRRISGPGRPHDGIDSRSADATDRAGRTEECKQAGVDH